jgi:hypothetical protein
MDHIRKVNILVDIQIGEFKHDRRSHPYKMVRSESSCNIDLLRWGAKWDSL